VRAILQSVCPRLHILSVFAITHFVFMFVRSPRHHIEISLTAGSPSDSVEPTPIPRVRIPSNSVHNNQYVTCRLWSELCLNALSFFPFISRSVDVSLSFGVQRPYESDCLLMETMLVIVYCGKNFSSLACCPRASILRTSFPSDPPFLFLEIACASSWSNSSSSLLCTFVC
jgi:hypothetical protein